MSSSFYSRRSRYGSTSYKDGGYLSDGGYHSHKLDSRLNKSRSVEDLTSTRAHASTTSDMHSSRSLADVYGASSAKGSRLVVDGRPSRRSYASSGYARNLEDREDRYGSRENLSDSNRKALFNNRYSGSRQMDDYRRRGSDTANRSALQRREVADRSYNQSRESSNQVKYRISGEIVRDNTSEENFRGYQSDTGHMKKGGMDELGYESEKAYGSRSHRSSHAQRALNDDRAMQWRSRSHERNNVDSDSERGRLRVGRGGYIPDRKDYDAGHGAGMGSGRNARAPFPGTDDYPGESRKPRSRSSSPMRRPISSSSGKMGSPSRRPRKTVGPDRLSNGDIEATASFPVCSRWPNCTVCSIDIPNSQIVSTGSFLIGQHCFENY